VAEGWDGTLSQHAWPCFLSPEYLVRGEAYAGLTGCCMPGAYPTSRSDQNRYRCHSSDDRRCNYEPIRGLPCPALTAFSRRDSPSRRVLLDKDAMAAAVDDDPHRLFRDLAGRQRTARHRSGSHLGDEGDELGPDGIEDPGNRHEADVPIDPFDHLRLCSAPQLLVHERHNAAAERDCAVANISVISAIGWRNSISSPRSSRAKSGMRLYGTC